jgi:ankyrin repeat protein
MGYGELHWTVDGQEVTYPEYNFENNQEMMVHLLGRWASVEDINCRCDLNGSTALHLAVAFVNVGAVQELLETGNVDKDIRNRDGETAEEICIEVIRTLESPEHAAVFQKYSNAVYEILHMLQD